MITYDVTFKQLLAGQQNHQYATLRGDEMTAARKTIALVAHDHRKQDLLDWAKYNRHALEKHRIVATGTTGRLVADELGFDVRRLKSGPIGGDQQLGALIAEGSIDILIFFWDPLSPLPHDPDVRALLRLAVVWNIPVACNRSTADFIFSSPLVDTVYNRRVPDFAGYENRAMSLDE